MTYLMVDAGKMILLFFWVGLLVGWFFSWALRDLDRIFKEYIQNKRNEKYYKIEAQYTKKGGKK